MRLVTRYRSPNATDANAAPSGAPPVPAGDPPTPQGSAGADPKAPPVGEKPNEGAPDPTAKTPPAPGSDPATPAAAGTDGVPPETYDLKPPTDSALTATDLERIAATARTLGLSQDHAQQLVEFNAQETKSASESAVTKALEAIQPGGAEWKKETEAWKAATLADTKLGATKEAREQSVQRGHRVVEKYAELHPDDGPAMKKFLDESGIGWNPVAARFFAWLGEAAGEGKLVTATNNAPPAPKDIKEQLWGKDGGRVKAEAAV